MYKSYYFSLTSFWVIWVWRVKKKTLWAWVIDQRRGSLPYFQHTWTGSLAPGILPNIMLNIEWAQQSEIPASEVRDTCLSHTRTQVLCPTLYFTAFFPQDYHEHRVGNEEKEREEWEEVILYPALPFMSYLFPSLAISTVQLDAFRQERFQMTDSSNKIIWCASPCHCHHHFHCKNNMDKFQKHDVYSKYAVPK